MKRIFLLVISAMLSVSPITASDQNASGSNEAEAKQAKKVALKYSTLIGEGLVGSGFHFVCDGKRYIACSLHQFKGEQPSAMSSMEFDEVIKITKRVSKGRDIQILTYDSKELDKYKPLVYLPTKKPKKGDRVICYNFDEKYAGVISLVSKDGLNYTVRMSKAFPAAGNSGTPVVSEDGFVYGVLLSADHPNRARNVTFEVLREPDGAKKK